MRVCAWLATKGVWLTLWPGDADEEEASQKGLARTHTAGNRPASGVEIKMKEGWRRDEGRVEER